MLDHIPCIHCLISLSPPEPLGGQEVTELRRMPRQVWAFMPCLETSLARVKGALDSKVSDRASEQDRKCGSEHDSALTADGDVSLQSLLPAGYNSHLSPVLSL